MKKNSLKLFIGAIVIMFVLLAFTPIFLMVEHENISERKNTNGDESRNFENDGKDGIYANLNNINEKECNDENALDFDDEKWPIQIPTNSHNYLPNGEPIDFENDECRSSGPGNQPLSRDQTQMVSRQEIVVIGKGSEGPVGYVLDDHNNSYGELSNLKFKFNDTLADLSVTTSGDLDNDGLDEIVCVVQETENNMSLLIWDDAKNGFKPLKQIYNITGKDQHVAVGDIDGDFWAEIAIVSYTDEGVCIYIYDDPYNNYKKMTIKDNMTGDRHNNVTGKNPCIKLADIDGDRMDEIILAATENDHEDLDLWFYNYNFTSKNIERIKIPEWWGDKGGLYEISIDDGETEVKLATGDITGDGTEEVLVLAYDDIHAYDYIPEMVNFTEIDQPDNWVGKFRYELSIVTGDVDGDKIHEVIVGGEDDDGEDIEMWIFDDAQHDFEELKYWDNDENWTQLDRALTAGDVDCDGYDEIIIFGKGEDGDNKGLRGKIYDDSTNNFSLIKEFKFNDNVENPVVTVAEVDADGLVLEYTGETWEHVTRANPFVAMAAPPTVQDPKISQNYASTSTTFGKSSFQSTGTSDEVGFSAFASVEVSAGFSVFGYGVFAKFSVSMSAEFSRTKTQAKTLTTGQECGGGSDYDLVIFEKTVYDIYKYKIVSSPDESNIGEFMNIKVPRETMFYKEPVKYFNQLDNITTKVEFKHKVGKPWTYSSRAVGQRLISIYGGWETGANRVGNSGGATVAFLSMAEEETTEESRTFSMEVAAGVEAGGVTVMAGVGFSTGHTHSITTGRECVYEGSVGDISDHDEYLKYGYTWGLYVYNYKRAGHVGYQVIDYWVRDYKGPMDEIAGKDPHLMVFYNNENVTDNITIDNSDYGVDAHVYGATQIDGHMGKALSFDGIDDYVAVGNPFFTLPPENFTASAFVKINDIKSNQTIIYSGERGEFHIYVENGKLFFAIRQEGKEVKINNTRSNVTTRGEPTWYLTSMTLSEEQSDWFHVAGTYQQGDNISLYMNGKLQDTNKVPNILIYDPNREHGMKYQASIGAYNQGESGFFNGSIDEIMVYDRPLNSTEINAEYTREVELAAEDKEGDDDGISIVLYGLVVILALLSIGMIAFAYKKPKEQEQMCKPFSQIIKDEEKKEIKEEEEEIDTEVCIYCGSNEDINKGHLIAPSKGGKKTVSACKICNSSKGDKALMEWLRWVKENKSERWESIITHNKGKRNDVAQKIHKIRDEPSKESKEKEDDEIET